jgi:hypothetical protein
MAALAARSLALLRRAQGQAGGFVVIEREVDQHRIGECRIRKRAALRCAHR